MRHTLYNLQLASSERLLLGLQGSDFGFQSVNIRARELPQHLSRIEKLEGRHRRNACCCSSSLIVIDVALNESDFAFVLCCERLKMGGDSLARTAPAAIRTQKRKGT
jgi:hypothetical protein